MVALILGPALGCGDAGSPNDAAVPDDGGVVIAPSSLCSTDLTTGNQVGDQFPALDLSDCEGRRQTLENLCEARASWMFIFAGW